ncbi:MAG: sugar-binding protein [Spirochaetota bacterium]
MRALTITLAILAIISTVSAKNLIKNSGFETGTEGYGIQRMVPADKEAVDTPLVRLIIDTNEKYQGRCSLRLDNSNGAAQKLMVQEVALEAGKKYTFSIWMKTSIPGTKVALDFRGVDGNYQYNGGGRSCLVTTDWANYSFSLTVPKGYRYYHLQLFFTGGALLWLDGLQIDEGNNTAYEPPPLEMGVSRTCARAYTFTASEPYPVQMVVRNNSTSSATAKVTYKVVDDYFGNTVKTGEETITVPAESTIEKMIANVSPLKRGSFVFTAELTSGGAVVDKSSFTYAVIDSVRTAELTDGISMCGQGFLSPYGMGYNDGQYYKLYGNSLNDWFDFLAESGVRQVRDWGGGGNHMLNWRRIEPAEGAYDWTIADRYLDEATKRGMKVVPCLGDWWCIQKPLDSWGQEYFPEWAKSRMIFSAGTYAPEAARGVLMCSTPPEELIDWQRFVKACVSRYKGRITHWEILNEPNVSITPEYYAAYLKMMNRIIKEADPNARVVGFCATGDLGGNMLKFLDVCFKLGTLDHCDAVSFHPYGAALDWTAPMSAEANNIAMRALVNKYGGEKKELWNTECFYLAKPVKNNMSAQSLMQGHELARRVLIDAATGVVRSFNLPNDYLFRWDLALNYFHSFGYLGGDLIPSRLFVIQNTLAREFTGVKFIKQVTTSGRNKLYLYERSAGPIAAAWSYDLDNKPSMIKLPNAGGKIRLIDIMGNTIAVPSGADVVMELNNTPFYIVPAGIDKQAFVALMDAASVRGKNALELFAQYTFRGATPSLAFEVKNTTPEDMTCFINAQVKGDALRLPAGGKEKTIPAFSAKTFYLPLEEKGSWSQANVSLQAMIGDNIIEVPAVIQSKMSASCTARTGSIVLDGTVNAAEWAGAASMILNRREQIIEGKADSWNGPDDFSGVVSATYDADALYVAMVVKKDGPRGERRDIESAWDGDAMELFIDTEPDSMLDTPTFTKNCFQILLGMPTKKFPGVFCVKRGMTDKQMNPANITSATATTAGGYGFEVRIPWSEINGGHLSGGGIIGFDVGIDNNVSDKRKWQMLWCGKNDNYNNRMNYGRLIMQ